MVKLEEVKVRLWRKRWLRTQDDKTFQLIWEQVKNLVHVPHGQFTECPPGFWESIKMVAVLKGLEQFSSTHVVVTQHVVEIPYKNKSKLKVVEVERVSEMTLLSYLRYNMEHAIKAEKRTLIQNRRDIDLDSIYSDDENTRADEICFANLADKKKLYSSDPLHEEAGYQLLIANVEARLKADQEPQILRAFRLKLKHPAITNRKIAKTLGVSKTYTSSYFRRLQIIISEVIEETDTLII